MLTIFDCDGVLVDSEPLAAEAMAAVLAEHGLIFPAPAIMQRCVGLSLKDILAIVAAELDAEVPAALPDRIWPATRALFAARLQPMPGLEAFLQAMAGPRCVASSSSPERVLFSLETTGLARYFGGHRFSASQVARGKPAPDLFLHAAQAMGAAPADCLVIEDSVAGVTAAVAAGMRVVGFGGGGHMTPDHVARLHAAGAPQVVAHWSQMPAALASMGWAG